VTTLARWTKTVQIRPLPVYSLNLYSSLQPTPFRAQIRAHHNKPTAQQLVTALRLWFAVHKENIPFPLIRGHLKVSIQYIFWPYLCRRSKREHLFHIFIPIYFHPKTQQMYGFRNAARAKLMQQRMQMYRLTCNIFLDIPMYMDEEHQETNPVFI